VSATAPASRAVTANPPFLEEVRKLPAFVRRDFLIAWSYRTAFVGDLANLALQISLFYLISRVAKTSTLPTYDGHRVSYMEFAVIGITLVTFATLALARVADGIRQERLMGTLESVLVTPTAPITLQLGTVLYDLLYVPIRTAMVLLVVDLAFGLHFHAAGIIPALLILFAFIPFIWGLGVLAAGGTLVFRRGLALFALFAVFMGLGSGAYFPVASLPGWLQWIADRNPMTIAADGLRESLLGGSAWSGVGDTLTILIPLAAVSLTVGAFAFRFALRHERRRGTIGLY
jgi:ABC-2 type transport system permease protein